MNMPSPVLSYDFVAADLQTSAQEAIPLTMRAAIMQPTVLDQARDATPVQGIVSRVESHTGLYGAIQQNPLLCMALILAFAATLLLAAGWSLYVSGRKRRSDGT